MDWDAWARRAIAEAATPRELLRGAALRLERARWT